MEYKNILNMINRKNINYYIINDSAKELYDYIFLRKKYFSQIKWRSFFIYFTRC